LFQARQEGRHRVLPERVAKDESDLRHDAEWDDRRTLHRGERAGCVGVVAIRTVEQRDDARGVERDHRRTPDTSSDHRARAPRLISAASVSGPFFHAPTHDGSACLGE